MRASVGTIVSCGVPGVSGVSGASGVFRGGAVCHTKSGKKDNHYLR